MVSEVVLTRDACRGGFASYDELLRVFWENHDPTIPIKAQYQSVIWPQNEAQRDIATRQLELLQAEGRLDGSSEAKWSVTSAPPVTEIRGQSDFYPAEAYHQRFWPKMRVRSSLLACLLFGQSVLPELLPVDHATAVLVFDVCRAASLAVMAYTILERYGDQFGLKVPSL